MWSMWVDLASDVVSSKTDSESALRLKIMKMNVNMQAAC